MSIQSQSFQGEVQFTVGNATIISLHVGLDKANLFLRVQVEHVRKDLNRTYVCHFNRFVGMSSIHDVEAIDVDLCSHEAENFRADGCLTSCW